MTKSRSPSNKPATDSMHICKRCAGRRTIHMEHTSPWIAATQPQKFPALDGEPADQTA